MKLVVPHQSWGQFFSQLKGFAHSRRSAYCAHPSHQRTVHDRYVGKDVAASGENVFAPEEFQIGFYVDPNKGGTPDTVARIVEDMKKYLSEVKDITITQTK